ncbi:MAG: ATP-binding cassette domain-containing protein, partial [Pseudomonadota bacterium]
ALLAEAALRYLRAQSLGHLAGRLDYLLGVEAFGRIIGLPPLFTERSTIGAQTSRLKEFENIREFFLGPLATVCLEVPFAVLYIVVIAMIGGPIALIPVALIAVFVLFGAVWFPLMRRRVAQSATTHTARQSFITETLRHLSAVKYGSSRDIWRERYRALSSQAVAAQNAVANSAVVAQTVAQVLMYGAGIAVLWAGTIRILAGDMTLGGMIAIMALVWRVLSPLQAGFLAFTKLQQVLAGVRHINGLMALKPEAQRGGSGLMTRSIQGRVNLNRVSFRYAADADPALLGVSLDVEPGELVALTGSNGSGKSTVLKLIAGLYMPQGGTLAVDGTDIRQIDPLELRRIIAYVQQVPALFHGTIAQNLRMADPTADDALLAKATAEVGILPAILSMPAGFETKLSDASRDQLPIGFFQRLVVARSLVRASPILLLDEPATALDDQGDRMLVDLLSRLKGTCTIIMVSHRPSHIRLADKAVVMDKASVVHVGTPDEALQMMFGHKAAA